MKANQKLVLIVRWNKLYKRSIYKYTQKYPNAEWVSWKIKQSGAEGTAWERCENHKDIVHSGQDVQGDLIERSILS